MALSRMCVGSTVSGFFFCCSLRRVSSCGVVVRSAMGPIAYFTIQTSFANSLSFGSAARASASESNLTRTLNCPAARSTYAVVKPLSMSVAAGSARGGDRRRGRGRQGGRGGRARNVGRDGRLASRRDGGVPQFHDPARVALLRGNHVPLVDHPRSFLHAQPVLALDR